MEARHGPIQEKDVWRVGGPSELPQMQTGDRTAQAAPAQSFRVHGMVATNCIHTHIHTARPAAESGAPGCPGPAVTYQGVSFPAPLNEGRPEAQCSPLAL